VELYLLGGASLSGWDFTWWVELHIMGEDVNNVVALVEVTLGD